MASSNSKDAWQHNLSTINERIEFLYNNKEMSDFNFIVGSTESKIPAHKFVLSVTSELFYNMFYMMQPDSTDVHVPHISCLSFLEFLRYVYKNELTLNMNNINDILQLSIDYGIPDLKVQCLDYLEVNLTNCTVIKILHTSIKCNLIGLKDKCLEIIGQEAKFIFRESDDFLHTDQNTLEIILQSNYYKCSEYEIFLGINKWLNYYCTTNRIENDSKKRKELTKKLFNFVKYDNMSIEELKMCTTLNVLTPDQIGTIFQKIVLNESAKSEGATKYDKPHLICNRFKSNKKFPLINPFNIKSEVFFKTNKSIVFCGLGIFGPTVEGCNKINREEFLGELRDSIGNLLGYHKQLVKYDGRIDIYEIIFDGQILLEPEEEYSLIVKYCKPNISVEHYRGIDGQEQMTVNDITFKFKEKGSKVYDSSRLAAIIFNK